MAQLALKWGSSGRNKNCHSGRWGMLSIIPALGRNRRHIVTMLVLSAIVVYFSYHLVSGNRGLFAVMQLTSRLEETQARLDEVKMERMDLQHRVRMMSPESLDVDLLDEQARKVLGHSKPGEIIYFLPEANQ